MGFRYQKRINLGNGGGFNLSKTGISYSQRTKYGTVGSRGFSVRTGIPGLTFRKSWGKGGGAGLVALMVVGMFWLTIVILYNLARLVYFLISMTYVNLRNMTKKTVPVRPHRRSKPSPTPRPDPGKPKPGPKTVPVKPHRRKPPE